MNKIMLYLTLLLFLSSFTSATSDQWDVGVLFWLSGDDIDTDGTIAIDRSNTTNGTLSGGLLSGQSCLLNECYFYDGTNDFLDVVVNNPTTAFTYNAWVKVDDLNNGRTIIMDDSAFTGLSSGKALTNGVSDRWNGLIYDGSFKITTSTTILNIGWTMVTLTWGLDNNLRLYINGTLEDTTAGSDPSGSVQLTIGSFNQGASNFFKGYIDEVSAYSRAWNTTEIIDAFNGGLGFNPFETVSISFIITDTPSDVDPETENTKTQLNLTITTTFHNLTASNYGAVTYNGTVYNATKTLEEYGISGNVTYAVNVTTPYITINTTAISYIWNYNLTINASDENNYSDATGTHNIIWSNPRLNITRVFNLLTNATITSFYGNYTIGINIYNFTSTDNSSLIPLIYGNGNYTVTIEAEGFAITNDTNIQILEVTDATNINITNMTFGLLTTNSLNITFYDVANISKIFNTSDVTVQFIGLTSITEVTSNGTLYVDLFTPDTYTILYDATGYEQGKYIIDITNKSHNSLNLYLQNSTESSLLLLTVKDTFGNTLESVEITIQRWLDNSWKTEQIIDTDFKGEAEAYYILSTVYYNHVLKYQGETFFGIINDDEKKKLIYAEDVTNGLNFRINIGVDSEILIYTSSLGVETSLTYTNTSNSTGFFRFYWSDEDNLDRIGCLKVRVITNTTFICNNCTTTATGIRTCVVNQSVGTAVYSAKGFIDGVVVREGLITIGDAGDDSIDWGVAGYVVAFFLVLIGFFTFTSSPTISIVVGTLIFVMLAFMGVIFKDMNYIVFITIFTIGMLVALIPSKNGGLNG